MSTLDKKYYHNIDLDSNELKAGKIYNLTTTQKNALSLTTTDKGYIVYDTTALSLYVWNGTAWTTAAGGSGTVTSVAAGTGMSFTTITGAGSVSIDTTKVPYLASGFSTGLLKYNGSAWVFDNSTYLTSAVTSVATGTGLTGGSITSTGTISLNSRLSPADSLTGNAGKFLRVNVGETAVEYATASSSGGIPHATALGTDTYTTTITGVTAYTDGDAYLIQFTNGNTDASTLNISSLGARLLYTNNDGAIIGGDIVAGAEMLCIYDSTITGFRLIGTSPNTLFAYVVNADSVAIIRGQPVYAFGSTGNRMSVKLAYNTTDSTSAQTYGLVYSSSIAANQKGIIIIQGVLDGINLGGTWVDGDPVYLGSTAGSLTKTKPYAPNHLVYLGVVERANTGNGIMYVRVQNGYELDELHNVQATAPATSDVLYYFGSNQWKTASIATVLGYTPISLTSLSGTAPVSYNSGTGVISMLAATTSVDGYLKSTDWTTFNGKQNALTNPVTGTGTINEIAYFNTTGSTISSLSTGTYPSLAELAYVKGVSSSIQTQLGGKQATITGAATTITSSNLTVSKALVSNASGKVAVSTVTDTELGYVSGVTSAIQTQLDSKVSSITFGSTGLSPSSPSFGVITVTGVLNATSGGTGLSSYAIGDIPYASTTTALSKLAAVAAGSYLRSAGTSTAPVWSTTTIPNTAVLGDIWYGSASNVITALTGNTTSTKKFLRQTGTGTVSAAPAWDTIAASDISGSALTIGSSDTNITLTTGGTASTALLNAASISVAWAGQLAVGRGGTGASTLTGVVIGAGTTAMTAVSSVSANQLFRVNGTGTGYEFFTPSYLTSVTPHNLLSATHGDTLTDTVVRGDIIIGNSTPKWSRLPFPTIAPSGKILQAGPTDVAWSTNPITIGASASVSGSNTGDQTITLSGDVTGSGTGSFGTTIASGVVKLDNMSKIVANSIIGNNTGALATPTALTGTNVTAMLDVFNSTNKGLVPAATLGALPYLFLASDGTWIKIDPSAISPIATDTIVANTTGLSASPTAIAISDLTPKLTTLVGDSGSGGTKGLVPAPASGDATAGKFLKADGLWAVPTTTIGTNVVTNAMLAQVATATFKGRTTPSTGNVEDLTVTQATAMLNLFSTAATTKGLVPGSNGVGSTYFLRADGTWAVPAGGGGGGGTTTNSLIIKADSGITEGTDLYTFDGSSAKTINIVAGTNITITKTAGTLTISSTGGSSSAVSSDHPVTLMTAFLNYT